MSAPARRTQNLGVYFGLEVQEMEGSNRVWGFGLGASATITVLLSRLSPEH